MTAGRSPFRAGLDHLHGRRFVRARRPLGDAVRARGAEAPWAAQELVRSFLRRGDVEAAEPALRGLLTAEEPLLDHALGYLARRLGRRAEARERFASACRRRAYWPSRVELGWMACQEGRAREGPSLLRAAERHFAQSGDDWGLSCALTHRATHALVRWRLREALATFARAEEAKRRCGDLLGLATVLNGLGQVHHAFARYPESRRAFEAALEIQQAIGFREGAAASLNALGLCDLQLADPESAGDRFRVALRSYGSLPGPGPATGRVIVRTNLGLARLLAGDAAGAERHYRRALEGGGGRDPDTLTVVNLARLLTRRGRPREALELVTATSRAGADRSDSRADLMLAMESARACSRAGEHERALEIARRCVRRSRAMDRRGSLPVFDAVEARALLGRLLLRAGRRPAALRALRAASHDLDELVGRQPTAPLRVGLLEAEDLHDVDDGLVGALLSGPAPSTPEAWEVTRRAKARELASSARVAARARDGELERQLGEIEAEVGHLVAHASLDGSRRDRLTELRRRHESLVRRVSGHARAAVDAPEGLGSAELARHLGAGGALLEYHVARERSWVHVVHGGSVETIGLKVGARALERRVAHVLAPCLEAGRSPDPRPWLGEVDLEAGWHLYRLLLEPALRALPADVRHLFVAPDGPLHVLPFGLLPTEPVAPSPSLTARLRQASEVRHVVDAHAVSLVPSSRALRAASADRAAALTALAHSPQRDGSTADLALRPLPEAEAECRAVASGAGGALQVGAQATAGALEEALGRGGTVHVAAHAVADERAPGLSGLVLAGPGGEPSFVSAERIAGWRSSAALVTLSACDTGRGRLRRREGVLGLRRAVHEAGTEIVLASSWPVDDGLTRELMVALHEELAGEVDPAEALARACRRHRAPSSDWLVAHPFAWGGWTLSRTVT